MEDAEASEDDEVKTPDGGDRMDLDEPGSGTGRSTRGISTLSKALGDTITHLGAQVFGKLLLSASSSSQM